MILTYLIVFLFIVLGFAFMAFMLYISRYKQRGLGCCADGIENDNKDSLSCLICPNKDDENIIKKQLSEIEHLR